MAKTTTGGRGGTGTRGLHTKIKNSGKYAKASALHKKLLLVSGPELVAGIDERIEIVTRTIAQMEKLMEMWA